MERPGCPSTPALWAAGPPLLLAVLQGAGPCWGLCRGANGEPRQPLSSSYRQPMCAKGCPHAVCPKCALCLYIY